jgi:hypothetical protein
MSRRLAVKDTAVRQVLLTESPRFLSILAFPDRQSQRSSDISGRCGAVNDTASAAVRFAVPES